MNYKYFRELEQLDETVAPSDYAPTKTGKAYKVFKVKNGKLYPPMVANPGGESTPVGVWLTADEGEFAGLSKTGRPQVKSTGSGKLAYRPGWHLGDLPIAKQFYRTNKVTGEREFPKDFVWAECDYVMEIDYQHDAEEQGYMRTNSDGTSYRSDKYQHSLAGLPKMPKDGFYRYRTNPDPSTVPWVITGAMKVNKLLSDAEVKEILASHGIEAPKREGGDKTIQELGLQEDVSSTLNKKDLVYKLNQLNVEQGNRPYATTSYDLIKAYEVVLREFPVGTVLSHEVEAGVEEFTKIRGEADGLWKHLRAPWKNIQEITEFDLAHWLAARINITRGDIKLVDNDKPLREATLSEDIEDLIKYYPNVKPDEFKKIIALDPTYKRGSNNAGTYGKWLLQLANKNNGELESEGHATDVLTRFEEVKRQLKNKDIGRFKSIVELEDYLNNENNYVELSDRQKLRLTQKSVRKSDLDVDADKVFEDSKWEVWVPKTYEASCKLGQGTSWCTASTSSDYYYNMYSTYGPLYININKRTGEKFQIHFDSKQYMDKDDDPINLNEFFSENPELREFYSSKLAAMLFKKNITSMDEVVSIYFDSDSLDRIFDLIRGSRNTINGPTALALIVDPYEEVMEWYSGENWLQLTGSEDLPELGEKSLSMLQKLNITEDDAQKICRGEIESPYEDAIRNAYYQGLEHGYIVGTADAAHRDALKSLYICIDGHISKCWYDSEEVKFYVEGPAGEFIDEYLADDYNEYEVFHYADSPLHETISNIIIDDYKCYYSQDGWEEFDTAAFDSVFADTLSEYID